MLLVTGGYHNGQVLDSTEILTNGASQWIYSGPLPTPRKELRAATINNKLLVTGKTDLSSSYTYYTLQYVLGGYNNNGINLTNFDDILSWDPINSVWGKIGSLKNERKNHGISVIAWDDVNYLCT